MEESHFLRNALTNLREGTTVSRGCQTLHILFENVRREKSGEGKRWRGKHLTLMEESRALTNSTERAKEQLHHFSLTLFSFSAQRLLQQQCGALHPNPFSLFSETLQKECGKVRCETLGEGQSKASKK